MLPIRWRLTIFHAVAILIVAALLLGILVVVTYRGVTASVEETARLRATQTIRLLESGVPFDQTALSDLAEGNVYVIVRDERGQVIVQTASRTPGYGQLEEDERESVWRDVLASGDVVSHSTNELYVFALAIETDRSPARVVEAWKSYDETGRNIIPFVRVVTFGLPVALVLAIVGSYLLARSAMAPVNAIAGAARDISERDLSRRLPVKRHRDELGRLATTINDLLARLEVAFRQREDTLARQRRFVADASHELRTPLTSLQGYARMLRQWALDDPATAREGIAAIEREAARMSELVDGLLRLARGDEGAPLERTEHDLRAVAAAAVDAARAAARGRVGVVYQPPSSPVVATLDRDRIRQVADILLDNAVKYTAEGGTVTITVGTNTDGVELAVADTGIGIPEEHLPHVFERFYRVDEARAAGGTGLGLAIARQLAEHHGGTIDVVSTPGRGSTFTLRLPVGGSSEPSRDARINDSWPASSASRRSPASPADAAENQAGQGAAKDQPGGVDAVA